MLNRIPLAGLIIAGGMAIAAGGFEFSDFSAAEQNAAAAPSPQWTQPAGAGISVPACGSASATVTCSGGAPIVTFSWQVDSGCSGDIISIWRMPPGYTNWDPIPALLTAGPLPCTGSYDWTGAAINTTYYYAVVLPGYHIVGNFSSFTTPNCALPTADIKANGSDGPIAIEYGQSVTLSWTSTNVTSCSVSPTGWSGTSGSQSTGGLTASQTYSLSCSGPGGSTPDSVTVNVGPQLTASCSVSPTSAITRQNVTWTASASGGVGGYGYTWSGDLPLSGSTGNPVSVQYTTSGTKNGGVTVTSGSQTYPTACSNSVTVYQPTLVIVPPTANVQADGGTAQLKALYDSDGPSGPSGEQTVTNSSNWSSSNPTKASVNSTGLVTGNTPGSATITATYTDGYNNTIPATASITVTALPPLSCSPSSQNVLIGQAASLSASGGTGNYNWSALGGSPSSGSGSNFSTTYSSSGTKTVTVSSGSQNAPCSVTVSSQPDLVIQSPNVTGTMVAGNTLTYSGTVKNQGGSTAGASLTRLQIDYNNDSTINWNQDQSTGSLVSDATEPESWTWTAQTGTHGYRICADFTNVVNESNEGNNCASWQTFTVFPSLSADLTPNDSSDTSPLTVNFTGTRIGGNDSQSTWYTFWWHCDNADTTYSGTRAACGDPGNSTIGREMSSGAGVSSVTTSHTYSTGTYRPKLIVSQVGPSGAGAEDRANVTVSAPQPQCSDGSDNDGDTKIDYPEDLGCSSSLDTDELNACTDGIDNDLDTKIDYKTAPNAFPPGSGDPGCSSLQDTSELDPPTFCEIPPDDPNATCP